MSDEEWYRDNVIRCPKCKHLQQDYENEQNVGWSGCTKHYKSKCTKCGFVGWVPEDRRCGTNIEW